jgi:hypothetical protein
MNKEIDMLAAYMKFSVLDPDAWRAFVGVDAMVEDECRRLPLTNIQPCYISTATKRHAL